MQLGKQTRFFRAAQEALGGSVQAEDLLLYFGPNDKKIGKQYAGDPAVDENKLLLSDYSVLSWLDRFPHWTLGARPLPPTPPPPGVATHRAAALAEGKDPDKAVSDARAKVRATGFELIEPDFSP